MISSSPFDRSGRIQRIIPYLALSRTPHGVIDMAAPVMAALLCLGHFPPAGVMLVGLVTVFAGYTAIYSLNDVVDVRIDQEKMERGGYHEANTDLDGILTRHPIAKGVLAFRSGLGWTVLWALVAMAGAYWLNPACLVLFVAGAGLEALYCKLFQVTPLRTAVNGVVKTIGSLAAVVAVDPDPSFFFLAILFLWIFFWEIGGQNIPNDWTDIEEDRQFNARTVPLYLGLRRTSIVIMICLVLSFFLHMALLWVSPLKFNVILLLVAVAANVGLLLLPGIALYQGRTRRQAMILFNRASHYPLVTLVLALVAIIFIP